MVLSQAPGRILVVDDEINARTALSELLKEEGHVVETASDGFKALPKLAELQPDVVLTDLRMPGLDGLGLMERVFEQDPQTIVILMTAHGAVDSAVEAMQKGAFHYMTKPIHLDELVLVIKRALETRRLRTETSQLRERLQERHNISNMVGSSKAMRVVYEQVLQVAAARASVLITGESGTGKELVAAALHQHSNRNKGPFVKLHAAALSETLLESELFGHEKGAFTGAFNRREGRLAQAHQGTLFLDEIGEISPSLQVKLLRFLQEHEFERVGGNQTVKVDVRIVAATNRDLYAMVKAGSFREDLYYRLNVVAIAMPPLREREEDIALLAVHFLEKFAKENSKIFKGFSEHVLNAMVHYPWPGNVRELENAVERAVVVGRGPYVEMKDIPQIAESVQKEDHTLPKIPGSTLYDIERYVILTTLEHVGGSTSQAAKILGISIRKIQYKIQEYQNRGDFHVPKENGLLHSHSNPLDVVHGSGNPRLRR